MFKNVCVYGGGQIGGAWAAVFAKAGCNVMVYDLNDAAIANAKEGIEKKLSFFAAPGVDALTKEQLADALARIQYTTDVKTAVENAEFIQENGPENAAIKRSIIAEIEKYNTTAIIASSTSGLLISDIAAEAKYPERIVGGHPYNPVHLIPLVELAKGEKTSDETLQKAKAFYDSVGKVAVILQKECLGFICNRIQIALNREAHDLVYRGVASVEDVDKAVVFGPGLRWGLLGPHLVQEMGGGKGGIRHIQTHIGPTTEAWLEDMAKWTKSPEGYVDIAEAGVKEEMSHRQEFEGRDHDGVEEFMSKGLITLLKYHHKL